MRASFTAAMINTHENNQPNAARISIRVSAENRLHHLWNNNGTWFLHYTVYPTALTKERIRRSLGTKDLATARQRRDSFFRHLLGQPDKTAVA